MGQALLARCDVFGLEIQTSEDPATELGHSKCHLNLMTSLTTAEPV